VTDVQGRPAGLADTHSIGCGVDLWAVGAVAAGCRQTGAQPRLLLAALTILLLLGALVMPRPGAMAAAELTALELETGREVGLGARTGKQETSIPGAIRSKRKRSHRKGQEPRCSASRKRGTVA
jgi:hypothetical protein